MFAKALNETLQQYGISASNLSRLSGVRDATISDFRTGKIDPKASTIEALLQALPDEPKKYLLFKILNSNLTTSDIFLELNSITDRIKLSLEQSDSEIRFLKTMAKVETKTENIETTVSKLDQPQPQTKTQTRLSKLKAKTENIETPVSKSKLDQTQTKAQSKTKLPKK